VWVHPERPVRQTDLNGVSLHLPKQLLDVIDRCVLAFLRGLARDNAGVRGSRTYPQSGGISYRMYCFAKARGGVPFREIASPP
jgi:hypothetical protein